MEFSRRQVLAAGLATLGGAATTAAQAQGYPNNVIRFVIPTPPGGGHDIMMRLVGQKLTERLGQPVIVESKPGATGAIAAQTVARAAPDGYTLLLAYSAFLSNLLLMSKPGYRQEDFSTVGMLALTPIALGISENLAASTLRQYVALAKTRPGQLAYASYGQGSGGHFVGELFNVAAGIETIHVPYKGEAPALQDVIGGQVQAVCASIGGTKRYPGRIRTLAVASAERSPSYPDVPTFAELGYPGVDMPGWAALMAPAGTPKAVVDLLTKEVNEIVLLPDVKAKIAELGFDSVGWAPDRTHAFFKAQLASSEKLVRSGRVKL
ncbi:MAG: Bug family tripartite tricarboxylate transporter substrate binding protein [Gammaproteobacteria bacterium]|uniref:Bug family tripartite tricarboxylate transporter substrate binding protein n=1 Tax=Pseudacidovorax sp. TaxID=1934311 RepID=UPI001B51B157|nr:tripartite tricarboxylate transporter substrate binding protein [Pseudacidovorax sp.]MBP6897460.1 tripartite tricarboxylate transporter substrate binding protein [Pseudacidovorax sp.]